MQPRRTSNGLTPLSIVLPHPQLPRRRSSLLSLVTSPRTPRTNGSPTCSSIVFSVNRKSTDSWNSSNQDLDDLDYDWKPDQILLLRRVCLLFFASFCAHWMSRRSMPSPRTS